MVKPMTHLNVFFRKPL